MAIPRRPSANKNRHIHLGARISGCALLTSCRTSPSFCSCPSCENCTCLAMPSMMESLGFEKIRGRGNGAWYKHKDSIFTCLRCRSLGQSCLWRGLLGDSYYGPFALLPCRLCSMEPGIRCDRCDAADEGFVLYPLNRHNWRVPCVFAFQNSFGHELNLDFLADMYHLRQIAKATCSNSLAAEEERVLSARIDTARSSFTRSSTTTKTPISSSASPATASSSATRAVDAKKPRAASLDQTGIDVTHRLTVPKDETVDSEHIRHGASKQFSRHSHRLSRSMMPQIKCELP